MKVHRKGDEGCKETNTSASTRDLKNKLNITICGLAHEQLDYDKDEQNMVAQWVVHARDIKDQRPQAETSGNARASALSAVTGDKGRERKRERVCVCGF